MSSTSPRCGRRSLKQTAGVGRPCSLRCSPSSTDEPGLTASELEEAFLALCRNAGLPAPAINEWVFVDDGPPLKADFLWREQRLIVEVDGWAAHGSRHRFEADRRRDQRARRAGIDTLRFTRCQVVRDPGWVAATAVAMLAR